MKRLILCSASLALAVSVLASALLLAQGAPVQKATAAASAIPRMPDGQPDFNGIWAATTRRDAPPAAFNPATGNYATAINSRGGSPVNVERDPGIRQRMLPNRPLYRPQYWSRVQLLDTEGATVDNVDPVFVCLPAGVPRMGAPDQIVQTSKLMIFIYAGRDEFRRIYMDGRPQPKEEYWFGSWRGHSVGHWEGDTLVIETVDFNDSSWLGWPGYFHSIDMRVTERMRREGNKITWQATVHDAKVLLQDWVMAPDTMTLNPDPEAELDEALPCRDQDLEHMVTKERG